jgi:hypothetical protein
MIFIHFGEVELEKASEKVNVLHDVCFVEGFLTK